MQKIWSLPADWTPGTFYGGFIASHREFRCIGQSIPPSLPLLVHQSSHPTSLTLTRHDPVPVPSADLHDVIQQQSHYFHRHFKDIYLPTSMLYKLLKQEIPFHSYFQSRQSTLVQVWRNRVFVAVDRDLYLCRINEQDNLKLLQTKHTIRQIKIYLDSIAVRTDIECYYARLLDETTNLEWQSYATEILAMDVSVSNDSFVALDESNYLNFWPNNRLIDLEDAEIHTWQSIQGDETHPLHWIRATPRQCHLLDVRLKRPKSVHFQLDQGYLSAMTRINGKVVIASDQWFRVFDPRVPHRPLFSWQLQANKQRSSLRQISSFSFENQFYFLANPFPCNSPLSIHLFPWTECGHSSTSFIPQIYSLTGSKLAVGLDYSEQGVVLMDKKGTLKQWEWKWKSGQGTREAHSSFEKDVHSFEKGDRTYKNVNMSLVWEWILEKDTTKEASQNKEQQQIDTTFPSLTLNALTNRLKEQWDTQVPVSAYVTQLRTGQEIDTILQEAIVSSAQQQRPKRHPNIVSTLSQPTMTHTPSSSQSAPVVPSKRPATRISATQPVSGPSRVTARPTRRLGF